MKPLILAIIILLLVENSTNRTYKHSKEELEETKLIDINIKPCTSREKSIIFVQSASQSTGKYYERRQTIRETWFKQANGFDIRVVFMIARGINESINKELRKESDLYADMLQFGFVDDRYNITLKAIAMFGWIKNNCRLSNFYVIKADDDVFINARRFAETKFESGLTGHVNGGGKVNRNKNSKWYIPESVYKNDTLPECLLTFAYVITVDTAPNLYDYIMNYKDIILDIEDLFITGIVADGAGVQRHHDEKFKDTTNVIGKVCGIEPCEAHKFLAVHGCNNTSESEELWDQFRESSECSACVSTLFKLFALLLLSISLLLNKILPSIYLL